MSLTPQREIVPQDTYSIDGVPGRSSKITLSFQDPSGSRTGRALPTGNSVDILDIASFGRVRASLIDVANPGVFVVGSDVGWQRGSTPQALDSDLAMMELLEKIRQRGAEMMGLDPNIGSIPKIVLIFSPRQDEGIDIDCQSLSMGQAHQAVPSTLALNLGVACKLPGTLAHSIAQEQSRQNATIGHPSGKIEVGADICDGRVRSALLHRTARMLMRGVINCG